MLRVNGVITDRMYGPQYNFKFSQIILCMTVWLFFMCVVFLSKIGGAL